MGGDGWDSPKLTEIGGSAINGSYFSNHYSEENKAPNVQKFIADYKAAYGNVPDGLAALGYDSGLILADAIKRANGTDGPALRDAINKTKGFVGVTGTITLDANRNPVKSAVVLKVDGGKFKYQTTINP
jgi:branched-chain amino acid transport system substrate-binding protein